LIDLTKDDPNEFINYNSPVFLKSFLERHGLGMQKKFGQNFLINPAARKILIDEIEILQDDTVWEIGPGLGAMTSLLLEKGAKVKAFEIDRAFCLLLKEIFKDKKDLAIIEGDVLKTYKNEIHNSEIKLFGNLPYNIGASLLADLIENNFLFKTIVVTVQKEVARRIAAKPGSKDYSSLSVLIASCYKTKLLPVLKGESFFPVPNVESQAVKLMLLKNHNTKNFAPLVRSLFASRRKTIKNNLQVFLKNNALEQSAVLEVLNKCNISPTERAENLCFEDFLRIENEVSLLSPKNQ
jgi:16S rRNA (adenine1518-N6/adenine1519-N6)-dimethyltransferase